MTAIKRVISKEKILIFLTQGPFLFNWLWFLWKDHGHKFQIAVEHATHFAFLVFFLMITHLLALITEFLIFPTQILHSLATLAYILIRLRAVRLALKGDLKPASYTLSLLDKVNKL